MSVNNVHPTPMPNQVRPDLPEFTPVGEEPHRPIQDATPEAGETVGRLHFDAAALQAGPVGCLLDLERLADRYGIDKLIRCVRDVCTVRGVELVEYIRKEEV